MRTAVLGTISLTLLGVACTDDGDALGSGQALTSENGERRGEGRGGPPDLVVSGEDGLVLDCERGPRGEVHVVFECDSITIYSCKDLSNVVLELEDGTRQRTEGLHGTTGRFTGRGDQEGTRIVGVWVKAGNNASGDGPGYGERFDAPEGGCDDPPGEAGGGGTGGVGGASGEGGVGGAGAGGEGGSGEDPCQDNDPDTFCGEGEPPPPPDDVLSCLERPNDPDCNVD